MSSDSNLTTTGPTPAGNAGNNNEAGGNSNKTKIKPTKKDTSKETKPKETELFEGLSKLPQFYRIFIDTQNRTTAMKGIKDAIGLYSTEKGYSIWKYLTENNRMLQTTDFWDKDYDAPEPADPDNPTFMERHKIKVYNKDYTARRMIRLKAFYDEESFGHSLYNIVKFQTSSAVWNNVEATVNFTQMARSRCVITLIRKLTVICQRGITGQRTDAIVDSLETVKKTLCYRQPNNKSPATSAKDLKESFSTAVEVGGTDAFGLAAMREAIADGVGNGMTVNQYFNTTLNTDDNQQNRTALFESFKQRIVVRLIVMNCKHKLVRNDIQHTQTYMRSNGAGVVESAWSNDISIAILMLMIQEDMQKQKKNGGGGSPNKKTKS